MRWPPAPEYLRGAYDANKQNHRQQLLYGYAKVDMTSIVDTELPDGAFRLHALLCRWCDWDGVTYPRVSHLARVLNATPRTINRWLDELVRSGLARIYSMGIDEPLVYVRSTSLELPLGESRRFTTSLDADVQSDRKQTSALICTRPSGPERITASDKEDEVEEDEGKKTLSNQKDPRTAGARSQKREAPQSITAAALLDLLFQMATATAHPVNPRYRQRAQQVLQRWLASGLSPDDIEAAMVDFVEDSLVGRDIDRSFPVFDRFIDYALSRSASGVAMRNELSWLMDEGRPWNARDADERQIVLRNAYGLLRLALRVPTIGVATWEVIEQEQMRALRLALALLAGCEDADDFDRVEAYATAIGLNPSRIKHYRDPWRDRDDVADFVASVRMAIKLELLARQDAHTRTRRSHSRRSTVSSS